MNRDGVLESSNLCRYRVIHVVEIVKLCVQENLCLCNGGVKIEPSPELFNISRENAFDL